MKYLPLIITLFLLPVHTGCGVNSGNSPVKITDNKEILYNCIELPEIWPPLYPVPEKPQNMPVPYLENLPEIITINEGRQIGRAHV